jgi:hypothetical protein
MAMLALRDQTLDKDKINQLISQITHFDRAFAVN